MCVCVTIFSTIMLKRKTRIRPVDDARTHIQSLRDKPEFMERFIDNNKGRGVFATQPVEAGAFVLEYRGELISAEECRARDYTELQSTFLFEFEWQKRHWCIDASKEDGTLGRLINDNHKSPNCTMKKIIVNDTPHLCLFAVKKIEIGSEIEYNYGDSQWPWRKKEPKQQTSVIETKTSLTDHSSHDASNKDAVVTQEPKQVFTIKGFSLVNYTESDETDEYIKDNPPSPHCDVVRKKTRNGNIQVIGVADFSDPLIDSNESIVDETDEDSSLQSDNEVVPKNLLMDRVPNCSVPLNESSDDSIDEPSTPMSGMASQRPRRNCHRPIQRSLVESRSTGA
uniref:SET domain-containing protein n=1 Tax=Cyprinus carpio carpio TaxID=630221 RepID=A0A9J8D7X3_CYPCA